MEQTKEYNFNNILAEMSVKWVRTCTGYVRFNRKHISVIVICMLKKWTSTLLINLFDLKMWCFLIFCATRIFCATLYLLYMCIIAISCINILRFILPWLSLQVFTAHCNALAVIWVQPLKYPREAKGTSFHAYLVPLLLAKMITTTPNKWLRSRPNSFRNWASTQEIDFVVCEQQRRKPGCACAQTVQRRCYSISE